MHIETSQPVFTIGHSNLEVMRFVALLEQHSIQAVADVRSAPYSRHHPQFNRDHLEQNLGEQVISYVFLGPELGARRSEPECYTKGRADYALVARTPLFQQGINRIVQGASKMRIALMCAEREPLDCHRTILISPHLCERGLSVWHILNNGEVENHKETEKRLLRLLNLPERDLFRGADEIVAEAYQLQAAKIAYQQQEPTLAGEQQRYGD